MYKNTPLAQRMAELEIRREFNCWLVRIGYCIYRFHYTDAGGIIHYTMDDRLLDIPLAEYLEKVPEKDRKKRTEYYLKGFTHFIGYSICDGLKVKFYWYDDSFAGYSDDRGAYNSLGRKMPIYYHSPIASYIPRLINSSDYKSFLNMRKEKDETELLECIKNWLQQQN
jgi:hypothetical protein